MALAAEHSCAKLPSHLANVFIVTMITEKVAKHEVAGRFAQRNEIIFR